MLILIGLLLMSLHCSALYPETSNVIELNPSDLQTKVINSDHIWIIEFYSPWCSICQGFIPEYIKTANALKGIIKVGAVNTYRRFVIFLQYRIRGFPTIKIFGIDKEKPEIYLGPRTAIGLINFTLTTINNQINANIGNQ